MRLRLATTFTLLLVLCSLVLGQVSVVHNGNNSIIHFGLVAEYRLNELGQQGFNYAGGSTTATGNLAGFPEQAYTGFSGEPFTPWACSGTGCTDRFAANSIDGQTTAARWVAAGATTQFVTQHPSLAAGQYTFSLYVKSNTGVTQKVRLGYHTSGGDTFSSDTNVTTSWNQITFTSTAGATITQIYMPINDVAQDALDILIYGAQVEAGASASAYVPADGFMQMGNYLSVDSFDPTRSTSTGINPTSGGAFATFSNVPALSNCTVYAVAKWSGGITANAYYEIVTEHFAAQQFVLSARQNGNPPTFAFGSTSLTTQGGNLNDSQFHIITGVYDGANMKMFVDNMQIGSRAALGLTQTLRQLAIGVIPDGTSHWLGNIAYLSIYNTGHTLTQIQNNQIAIANMVAKRPTPIVINNAATSRYYVAEGDSITDYGNYGRAGYFYLTVTGVVSNIQGGNDFATSGGHLMAALGVPNMQSREADVDALYNPNRKVNVLSILIGANDINSAGGYGPAAFVADLKAYCLRRMAVGWKIILLTELPQSTAGVPRAAWNTDRNAANVLIRADTSFYAALADIAGDSNIGCDTCANTTTYYLDGVHPNNTGEAIIATYTIPAMQAIY